ncbi:C39 family peptidase [Sphingomonas beigongshangi]|uniref:C39 family peptidase n=1 Tax=Sphingomonas beigongshangi TaxID=2782540 RepID=UPI00193B910A|nr:C39 family peptidase [Sphingomonas beigongshangi]
MRPTPAWLIPAMLGLTGCAATIAPADPHFAGASGAIADYQVPVASMLARKFATVVRQQYDFSCGSAALATLLRYHYGLPRSEADVFTGMWRQGDQANIRKVGFSLLDMKRYLADSHLQSDGYKVTLDAIAARRLPGIALITYKGYRHFVVVKGITADTVLLGDPSLGLHAMPREAFQRMWNGVYFVLNSATPVGTSNFNGVRQWQPLARAPINTPFLDPLSLQALTLSAPFYRDF